jgi:predicted NAD-dependent protein-ADP-ribosyltransferase YbiA (DUF1768 family)
MRRIAAAATPGEAKRMGRNLLGEMLMRVRAEI